MATASREDIVKSLKAMPLLEVADLVKELEEVFGVSAAAPVAVAAAAAPGEGAAAEQDSFDVILTAAGDNKISAIKEVRVITGLGLKEAKDLVEAAPKAVKEGLPKEEAEKIMEQLIKAGAKAELK